MNRLREMWNDGGTAAVVGSVGLNRRLRFAREGRRRAGQSPRVARRARVVAGTLCGLGVALFPGLAILAVQLCLVLAWAYLMISLVVGGLRGASRGFR